VARKHGKDLTVLTLGGQSLLADTVSIDYADSADTHDTHTLGDQAKESTAGLTGGDDLSWVGFYDNAAGTGTWAYLTGKVGAASSVLVIGDGVRSQSVSVIVTKVALPVKVNDMMMVNATFRKTGVTTYS
jgi:hypothetical protein